jgi:hypothetical protein
VLPEGPYRDSSYCTEERVRHIDHSYSTAERPPGSRGDAGRPERGAGVRSVVKMSDVPMTSPRRSGTTWRNAGQRSARSSLDNCYSDYATTNAQQLMDLLSSANVTVVPPQS